VAGNKQETCLPDFLPKGMVGSPPEGMAGNKQKTTNNK
jgi:hypothetical protein